MFAALSGVLSLLTSGVGGGIFGAVLGFFKKKEDAKQAIAIKRLSMEENQLDRAERRDEREHELKMLDAGAQIKLQQTEAEIEGEITTAHQSAMTAAQIAEFKGLNTTQGMDNYRGSVRPTLAYTFSVIFLFLTSWAFYKFNGQMTDAAGYTLLVSLLDSLMFIVSSITHFYFMSRPEKQKK